MPIEKQTQVVIIEDERSHAEIIRKHVDKVLADEKLINTVEVLPSDRPSFYRMEEFAKLFTEQDRQMRAFLIVDLFLAKRIENPSVVFHQLMYNLFESPVDPTLVCGRLGVLSKLKDAYPNAYVELFSFFPLYFATQNEPVENDRFIYADCDKSKIKQLVRANEKSVTEYLKKKKAEAWDDITRIQMIQTIAMRDAIYERIEGIFSCTNVFDHMTEDTTPPNGTMIIGTQKTKMLHEDAEKLAQKMAEVIKRSEGKDKLS